MTLDSKVTLTVQQLINILQAVDRAASGKMTLEDLQSFINIAHKKAFAPGASLHYTAVEVALTSILNNRKQG